MIILSTLLKKPCVLFLATFAPPLRPLLSANPTRAYFSSVALAVLEVASKAMTPSGDVDDVLRQYLIYVECLELLKPLMYELSGIALLAKTMHTHETFFARS
jgi:hypothetical protein